MKWRKWNRAIHRDLGYFFFGMSVIYGLSGIALNHVSDWNPSYKIERKEISISPSMLSAELSEAGVRSVLQALEPDPGYKSHYYPNPEYIKIFTSDGSLTLELSTGKGILETIRRRPVLREVNFLHYNNPKKLWTWFSDLFAASLIILAVTGLFILHGKHGITRRGAWLTLAGIIIPVILLILYL